MTDAGPHHLRGELVERTAPARHRTRIAVTAGAVTTAPWPRGPTFEAAAPELAAAGQRLLYQFGPGLGFLATVRPDGGPRLHPICPVVADGELWAFILRQSPKCRDLERDGRYALHSFPPVEKDDEFAVTGRVRRVDDAARPVAGDGGHQRTGR